MSVERRPTDKVFKAQKARDETSLGSRSLFAPASGSAPLPNRRPTAGSISKYTPTAEEVAAIPPFRGEEQPVEKYAGLARHWEAEAEAEQIQKARRVRAHDGTYVTELDDGTVYWSNGDPRFAGMGIAALEKRSVAP